MLTIIGYAIAFIIFCFTLFCLVSFVLVLFKLTNPNRIPYTPPKGHWIGSEWVEDK